MFNNIDRTCDNSSGNETFDRVGMLETLFWHNIYFDTNIVKRDKKNN